MPVSKKRKHDDKKRRARDGTAAAARPAPESPVARRLFTRMRGGIKSVAGTVPKKPESLISKVLTWALIVAAAYFVAKRFGIVP
jgi:hypothetical protein